MYTDNGYEFNLTTTTPALTNALKKHDRWMLKRFGREKSGFKGYDRYKGRNLGHLQNTASRKRVTFSFVIKKR